MIRSRHAATIGPVVLEMIGDGPVSGEELRNSLAGIGHVLSGPQFYAMMAHLEDDGKVNGFYEEFEIDGIPLKRRCYTRNW